MSNATTAEQTKIETLARTLRAARAELALCEKRPLTIQAKAARARAEAKVASAREDMNAAKCAAAGRVSP
jgi:hypothetical protein